MGGSDAIRRFLERLVDFFMSYRKVLFRNNNK